MNVSHTDPDRAAPRSEGQRHGRHKDRLLSGAALLVLVVLLLGFMRLWPAMQQPSQTTGALSLGAGLANAVDTSPVKVASPAPQPTRAIVAQPSNQAVCRGFMARNSPGKFLEAGDVSNIRLSISNDGARGVTGWAGDRRQALTALRLHHPVADLMCHRCPTTARVGRLAASGRHATPFRAQPSWGC